MSDSTCRAIDLSLTQRELRTVHRFKRITTELSHLYDRYSIEQIELLVRFTVMCHGHISDPREANRAMAPPEGSETTIPPTMEF